MTKSIKNDSIMITRPARAKRVNLENIQLDLSPVKDEAQIFLDASRTIDRSVSASGASSAPKITVEGVTLSTGASPVPTHAASDSSTVSIIQDATDDAIKQKIIESSIGPQPVILSSVKLPAIKPSDIDDAIEISQFERQVIKESVVKGLVDVLGKDPKGAGTAAKESFKRDIDEVKKKVSALSYMQETANIASTGLDVSRMSEQIMQRASDAMSPLVFSNESSNKPLPKNIDEYISLTFPNEDVRMGVDGYLTNTSRLIVLAQDMLLASLSSHPTVLMQFSRNPTTFSREPESSLFTPPGAYGYDPDGAEGNENSVQIPTVSQMFAQNSVTIANQFIKSKSDAFNPKIAVAVLNKGNINTVDEAWDAVLHLITCISNELVLSAGIGRLIGSQLGNRFLETSSFKASQYSPFNRVLGFSPLETSKTISRFFETGPDRAGSFLDYLALGEEAENEDFVVMPFEVNTVIHKGKPYVSGKKYFIDLAMQTTNENAPVIRGALRRFSSDINKFSSDMSAYLTQILALDVDTKLAPQVLMARVLQDFSAILGSLDRPESSIDAKSAVAASLFSYAGHSPSASVDYNNERRMRATVSDIMKMSVVKALRDFDRLTDDSSFKLSNKNTDYQTVSAPSAGENPEISLRKSIIELSKSAVIKNPTTKMSGVNRVRYEYSGSDVLHDNDFSASTNIINLIVRTIREMQKEALNLAQRDGAKSDYRNNSGGTFMSDCDDDRFIDVVCDLYFRIAYLLLPVDVYKRLVSRTSSGGRTTDRYEFVSDSDLQSVRIASSVVQVIAASLANGSEITPDSVQYSSLVDPGTPLSVGGTNDIVTKSADIALAASRIVKHRYYIKASLKILESAASGIAASSSKMSSLFDILNNKVKKDTLKDLDLTLYEMFVTNKSMNEQLLNTTNEYQTNLCRAALHNYVSEDDVFMRKDVDTTRSERLAARDFVKSIYDKGNLDDLHVMSIGLPNGMLESLYRPALEVEGSDRLQVARMGTEGQRRGRTIRVEIDRYDDAHFNSVSTVESDIFGKSPSPTEFDPEIFILPDSITYNPDNKPSSALNVMDAIFQTTTFYRIRNGLIVEKTPGTLVEPGQERMYVNALRSYLLDLFLYDTVKLRYMDGLSPYGPLRVTKDGYSLIKETSDNFELSKSLLNVKGYSKIFDDKSYQIKDGIHLNSLLRPRSTTQAADFSETDVRFASVLSCMSPLMSTAGIITNRPYERIYNFLYDESIVRSSITGDDISMPSKRKQFDIFTLAIRVAYGGGQ